MNAIANIKPRAGELVTAEHADAIRTALKSSLYPGASDASVDMVLAYCKAAGLDPMQKPVHIVPMWDGNAKAMRDVVMPGIGLYRTNAARTGQFAGMSEPVFGPMVTERVGNTEITFPEWCKVTAYRQLPSGHVAEFTAVEYWIENYAIKGGSAKDQSPNAMWSKRVRGQLAKCTQAQAMRMAFPEATGAGPTAEEMEGKAIIEGEAAQVVHVERKPPELPEYPQADFDANLPKWVDLINAKGGNVEGFIAKIQTKSKFTDAQLATLRAQFAADPASDAEAQPEGDPARDKSEADACWPEGT